MYDYDEFFEECRYQEEVDILEEAIKKTIKSDVLEEMKRLQEENKKLNGIKNHFEEIKMDFDRKKEECDRKIREAEVSAKRMRLREIMEEHKVIKWKPDWRYAYGPKCDKCDKNRNIDIRLPSGKLVKDDCSCKTKGTMFYYPLPCALYELSDNNGHGSINALYKKCKCYNSEDVYFDCESISIGDRNMKEKTKEILEKIETMDASSRISDVMFDTREECAIVCDKLNEKLSDSGERYSYEGKLLADEIERELYRPDEEKGGKRNE